MFRLKSNALQREFKVNEGYLYLSLIHISEPTRRS